MNENISASRYFFQTTAGRHRSLSCVPAIFCAFLFGIGAAFAADLHVSPKGNDATGDGSALRPFGSIERSRDAARKLERKPGESVRILLHGGQYRLEAPVVFSAADSGTPEAPFVIGAAPGETPVITSATAISEWEKAAENTPGLDPGARGKVFVAAIPKGWRPHFLYVSGKSMPVARWHKDIDWHNWATFGKIGPAAPGGQELGLHPQDAKVLEGLPDNGDVEANIFPECFWNTISVVKNIDPKNGTFRSHSKNPTVSTYWGYIPYGKLPKGVGAAADYHGQALVPMSSCPEATRVIFDTARSGKFTLLNALKFLTAPGEWCVDSGAGRLYFWPEKDGPPAEVVAPRAYRLIELAGKDDSPVHDIVFSGLTFTCTDRLPEDRWPDEWIKRQAELPDSMLLGVNTRRITVDSCRFLYSGSYGVAFQREAVGNRVTRNEIGWPGCGGVQLQGRGPGGPDVNKGNDISRNYIHHTGNGGYMHSAAFTIYQSGGNTISLNWFDHLPYAAVQICGCGVHEKNVMRDGATCVDSYGNNRAMYGIEHDGLPNRGDKEFTRSEFRSHLTSGNNTIEDNIVTNYMEWLGDGGALYSWSCGTGNVWRNNLLHEEKPHHHTVCLYMDDNSDQSTLTGNIAWHHSGAITARGEDIIFRENVISSEKPEAFDRRFAQIARDAARAGGWLAKPEDQPVPSVVMEGPAVFTKNAAIRITPGLEGILRATVDGSEPTASSPQCKGFVNISGTTTIRAAVFGRSGKPLAPSVSKTFTVATARPLKLGEWVQAAEAAETGGGARLDDSKTYIGWTSNGSRACFGVYDFPAGELRLEIQGGTAPGYGGKIHVCLDSPTGPEVGVLEAKSTGGWESYQTFGGPLKDMKGKHMLCFIFEGGPVCSLKSFRLMKKDSAQR